MVDNINHSEGIILADLDSYHVQPEAVNLVPESDARKYVALPLAVDGEYLHVALAKPDDVTAIRELERLTQMKVEPIQANAIQILAAVDRAYKTSTETIPGLHDISPTTAIGEVGVIDLNTYRIQSDALSIVPESLAKKHNVIPLAIIDNALQVGIARDNDIVALQELSAVVKMRIETIRLDADDIRAAIDRSYRAYQGIEGQFSSVTVGPVLQDTELAEDISSAPAVRALDTILNEAVKVRASDVHFEPEVDGVRVRYRIDGVLQEAVLLPRSALASLLSRMKIMANMNIADHQPQDGQFTAKVRNRDVDVRVATLSTIYGETGTLRILDKSLTARSLDQLGFLPDTLQQYQTMLKSPLGMILISGPTGSGKTTTQYASINTMDSTEKNIITIEDPVEYRFKRINQIQVNPKAGLTFARGLRSIMRHDPDVIMVGEIRDSDTAEIACQSALTGQLVLSSVHANDAVSSIFRMLDLGIGRYLLATTLIGVVSQRMLRRICPHCAHMTEAPPEAEAAYNKEMGENKSGFLYGKGCNACNNTGYLGRIAVFEIMVMNKEIRAALTSGVGSDPIRAIADSSGMVPMWRDAMLKVQMGITTPSEVLRNVFYVG
ncbi:MAG TPA: type II/IV secretion system protein [Dehalococcoidia bacterium]|nr:type II/IV secretion system protein [Dehalococcoidia bacterium]